MLALTLETGCLKYEKRKTGECLFKVNNRDRLKQVHGPFFSVFIV